MNARKLLVSLTMLVSALLSACAPATTPPSATPIPTTAVPPTAAPTITVTQGPTTYSPEKFALPMSVNFGPEWHVDTDLPDEFLLVGGTQAYEGVELVFMLVKDAKVGDPASNATLPWPDDFVAYLHSNGYLEVGEPTPITVGGLDGVQIDVAIKKTGEQRTLIELAAHDWFYLDYDQNWRFIILDNVNGKRLLIGATEAPEGFSAAVELADRKSVV